jgi:UDP:flavonoid glycosyltransferase YjiC (YdhE family)
MHITILAVGSQGDVQPYAALGAGLRSAGHDVTLATSARFAPLVAEAGLRHAALQATSCSLSIRRRESGRSPAATRSAC